VTESPLLSVVITSYTTERLKDIFELLDSLNLQTYRNIETILVTEKLPELFEKLSAYVLEKRYPNSRVIYNDGTPGISASRNTGINRAKGEIVAFIDDDALPFPDWAEKMVKAYRDDKTIGITGPAFPKWETGKSPDWFPEEFYWIFGCSAWRGLDSVKEIRNTLGANMSFRREAFDGGRLFSPSIGGRGNRGQKTTTGDETELSLKVKNLTGKRILFDPGVKVWHKVTEDRLDLGFIRHRAYIEGYSKGIIKRFYGGAEDPKVLATEYALLWRIFTRVFPDISKKLFTTPGLSWKKLQVTIIVLTSVGLGYLRGTIRTPEKLRVKSEAISG
jgi:glycosyltransferase involved in cell wall biosynthesis